MTHCFVSSRIFATLLIIPFIVISVPAESQNSKPNFDSVKNPLGFDWQMLVKRED